MQLTCCVCGSKRSSIGDPCCVNCGKPAEAAFRKSLELDGVETEHSKKKRNQFKEELKVTLLIFICGVGFVALVFFVNSVGFYTLLAYYIGILIILHFLRLFASLFFWD